MRTSLQGIRKWSRTALFLWLGLAVLTQSCKKDDELLTLTPDGGKVDGIVAGDLALIAYTVNEDSLKTDSLRANLLGAMNDPEFGKSEASVITQVQLPEINIDFGDATMPDSIVLSIPFRQNSALFGDTSSTQTIRVYRVEEELIASKNYYSSYTFNLGSELGQWTGTFNTEDSVYYTQNGVEVRDVPQLRIVLNPSFGQEFIDADPTVYTGKSAFLEFLKGIALVSDAGAMGPGQGSIAEINLGSTAAKLTLFYSDTLSKVFPITPESERINTYRHPEIAPAIQMQIDQPGVNYSTLYVQPMAGTKVKIDLPDIFKLVEDGQVMINEAKLTLPVKSGTISDEYDVPPRLLLLQPSEKDGSNAFILDLVDQIAPPSAIWVGYSNYGGGYDAAREQYVFRFTRHLQQVLDEYYMNGNDVNRGLYVVIPSDNPVTASRLILDNDTAGTGRKIELKVTYTKL